MIMKTVGLSLVMTSMGFAALTSLARLDAFIRDAQAMDVDAIKKSFLTEGGLMDIHNKVYQEVGEGNWEGHVKPLFLRDITIKTIQDTGNVAPTLDDVTAWVKAHQTEARDILQLHGATFRKKE